MSTVLTNRAISGGTYSITVPFKDEDGFSVIPTSITWTLLNESGNVVNGRLNVEVTPASSITILLSGADITLSGDSEEVRYISLKAIYDNAYATGLESIQDISFFIGVEGNKSLLFLRSDILGRIKSQQLSIMNNNGLIKLNNYSDDYIWQCINMAEASLERSLGVYLTPMLIVPDSATQDDITSLNNARVRYKIDPGHDYDSNKFITNWNFINLRNRPIINIEKVDIQFPYPGVGTYQVPDTWVKVDKRGGTIQLVPGPLGVPGFLPQAISPYIIGFRDYPLSIKIRYLAGLINALRDYPEILEIITRMTIYTIISGSYTPVGGSISIDGMSQSLNYAPLLEYQATTDRMITTLRSNLLGIQMRIL